MGKHKTKPKGNPNPSPATRFGAGQKGNPIGMTSEQRQAEIRNAWIATNIRTRLLEKLKARLEDEAAVNAALEKLNINALLKDSEDRGLGAPKAAVDLTNSDGSLKPEPVAALVHDALTKLHDTE